VPVIGISFTLIIVRVAMKLCDDSENATPAFLSNTSPGNESFAMRSYSHHTDWCGSNSFAHAVGDGKVSRGLPRSQRYDRCNRRENGITLPKI
jgi:hypothetical protein